MTKLKKSLILCVLVVFLLLLFNSSPGKGFINGYADNCGNCHGGESSTISIELVGFPEDASDTSVYNGTVSYNLKITVTDSSFSSSTGGVWITVDKGTLGVNEASLKLDGTDLVHTGNSATSWNFTWTAPAAESGWVQFVVYGMVSNGVDADGDYWGDTYFQIAEYIEPSGNDTSSITTTTPPPPPPPPPNGGNLEWWRFDARIGGWIDYIFIELEPLDLIILGLAVALTVLAIYIRNWLLGFLTIIGMVAALCFMIPEVMTDFVFDIMPLITLGVLIVGIPIRVSKWLSGQKTTVIKPESLKKWIQLFLYAIEGLALDLVFFRRIFRQDKKFWAMVWPMHISAILLILSGIHHKVHGYAFGISGSPGVPVRQLINIGIDIPALEFDRTITLIIALIFLGEIIILTLRRKMTEKVNFITKPDVYLDLLVLMFLAILGVYMFFAGTPYNESILALHAFFALLYFLSIPFTFYTHIFGGAIITVVTDGLRRAQLEI
ncbi:MAG: choice-of-anchor V domain-containing protein [Candidatus Hodarchaeales archaeon]|jgi:nitrate reductase gamma subunit